MNIVKATKKYEAWLVKQTRVVASDLERKHMEMAKKAFSLLRATFYRWLQVWPEICPDLDRAPRLLGVGDLHVENFGTWRDTDGRLVWGINDFDEASEYPYTMDLVRLSTSALMAARADHITIRPNAAIDAILTGYMEGMSGEGRPFVLAEDHAWLRLIVESKLRDPVRFWNKLDSGSNVESEIPKSARKGLEQLLPEKGMKYRLVHREAGLGSRGHMRFVAIANWKGGRVAREAKALVPSPNYWLEKQRTPWECQYAVVLKQAVRCPDPYVCLCGNWIIRRLSPHCCRIELTELGVHRGEIRLLRAMGRETANVHLGTQHQRTNILKHLRKQKAQWLRHAAEAMASGVERDWLAWKAAMKR